MGSVDQNEMHLLASWHDDLAHRDLTIAVGPLNSDARDYIDIRIPLLHLWGIYTGIAQLGAGHASFLVMAGRIIEQQIQHDVRTPFDTFGEVWLSISKFLTLPPHKAEEEDTGTKHRKRDEREEQVLGFTYLLLHGKQISREEAARIAAFLLKWKLTNDPEAWQKDVDAWRKKQDRWIDAHNLPVLGQTKRRPRSQKINGR